MSIPLKGIEGRNDPQFAWFEGSFCPQCFKVYSIPEDYS